MLAANSDDEKWLERAERLTERKNLAKGHEAVDKLYKSGCERRGVRYLRIWIQYQYQ